MEYSESESQYDSEDREADDKLLTEEVYLSFLRSLNDEYTEFGSDLLVFKELNMIVDEVLRRWYDEGLKKVYDEYMGDEKAMFEPLMNKTIEWLESRV